jgi:DNA-binding MarR family transcriptional regulator
MIIDTNHIPANMGASVLRALCIIAESGPMQANRLAKAIGCSTANVTGILDSAYIAGVLNREYPKSDRRKIRIVMTEAGSALVERLRPKALV